MTERKQVTPIKLKSLREQRDIIRSNSNRPHLFLSPIFEIPKPLSEEKIKFQNRTPVLTRFRKIDSPKSIYESNLQLIEKANAAMEVLEVPKEKSKQNSLLFKREKNERVLKSGLVYKPNYKNEGSKSPEFDSIPKIEKKGIELDFGEESKKKKLSKVEAKNLISRLQGGVKYYKKY